MNTVSIATPPITAMPMQYRGNKILLLTMMLLWMPFGLVLLIKNASLQKGNSTIAPRYKGSMGWLFFWSLVFYPIGIIMMLVNGFDFIEQPSLP